jgi:chaperonin cofactor prefoldin
MDIDAQLTLLDNELELLENELCYIRDREYTICQRINMLKNIIYKLENPTD